MTREAGLEEPGRTGALAETTLGCWPAEDPLGGLAWLSGPGSSPWAAGTPSQRSWWLSCGLAPESPGQHTRAANASLLKTRQERQVGAGECAPLTTPTVPVRQPRTRSRESG